MINLKACLRAYYYAQLLATAIAHRPKPAINDDSRPNIVMIMTDDQDVRLNSLDFQPAVRKFFTEQGTKFEKHYCTVAQCCPSRVSLLTGKAAHNTNVTDIIAPYGGYGKFVEQGFDGHWLPSWFQQNGYNTYYTGKLMNNHSIQNYNMPFPDGFTATDFLVDPGTYIYYNATMQSNQDAPRNLPGNYSTDLVAQRAIEFMQAGKDAGKPFFLTVAPIAPHRETLFPHTAENPSDFPIFAEPVPANRHRDKWTDVNIPRQVSFNNIIMSGHRYYDNTSMGTDTTPSYLATLSEWNQTVIDYYDKFYRGRLAALAAVDDLVISVMESAEKMSLLENTYFIYTSDNGYHIGQHRLPAGKSCGYEEDINVPFIVHGLGIAKNQVYRAATSHTDIAPTLFSLADIPLRDDFDGQPMPLFNGTSSTNRKHRHFTATAKQEHINVEFWGSQLPEGLYGRDLIKPTQGMKNTYKSVRLISDNYDYYYAVWCTGQHELYNVKQDPYQTTNLAVLDTVMHGDNCPDTTTYYQGDLRYVQARLDTLLIVLKTCKAEVCRDPWRVIHPSGDVKSFSDAMNPKYNQCYQNQPRFEFTRCRPGYLKEFELPDKWWCPPGLSPSTFAVLDYGL